MSKYRVYMVCSAVHMVDIEAESEEEAQAKAYDMPSDTLADTPISSTNDWYVMEVVEKN